MKKARELRCLFRRRLLRTLRPFTRVLISLLCDNESYLLVMAFYGYFDGERYAFFSAGLCDD